MLRTSLGGRPADAGQGRCRQAAEQASLREPHEVTARQGNALTKAGSPLVPLRVFRGQNLPLPTSDL
jgi:hypothetical protein